MKGMEYACCISGKNLMTYTNDTGKPKGPTGLQLHGSRDMTIDYRNLRGADL